MTYRDKSRNIVVTLTPSKTDFLAVGRSEGEGVAPAMRQKLFTVTRSTNADRVFILRARSEQESAVALELEVAKIRDHPEFEAVVPGLIDQSGITRFALPGRIHVKVRNGGAGARGAIAAAGGGVFRAFRASQLLDVQVPNGVAVGDFIEHLNALDDVVFAEPAFYAVDDQEASFKASVTTARARKRKGSTRSETEELVMEVPWHHALIDLGSAWQLTRGASDVVVAIVDGAPDVGHTALLGKFLAPLEDALYFSSDRSVSSHSTNIASVVAGQSAEITGMAPGVRLLPLVVNLSSQVYAERAEALATAAEIARSRRWSGRTLSRLVVSCSWRTSGDISVIRTALQELAQTGTLIVFSAGNDGIDAAHYPSDYGSAAGVLGDAIVSVAATQRDDRRADYSNYSAAVTVAAPGGDGLPLDSRDILCADQGGTYEWAAGTSIAAPHVAALAALMLSVNPALQPADLKRLIGESADDISPKNPGFELSLGAGRINARRAVQAAAAFGGETASDKWPVRPPAQNADSEADPAPDAGVDRRPLTPTGGPSFRAETVIPPSVQSKVLEQLAQLNHDIEVLTGWSVTAATLSRDNEGLQITIEL